MRYYSLRGFFSYRRLMGRICTISIFLGLFLAMAFYTSNTPVYADAAGYTIQDYAVHIALDASGSMNVKETITVFFQEERHGIYREIPIKDPQGDYIHITDFSVGDDPIASLEIKDDMYVLKIGDANETIRGEKVYTILYHVKNAIKAYTTSTPSQSGQAQTQTNTMGTRQELYRNIIGTQWNVPIAHSSWRILLPQNYMFSSDDMFVKRGAYGQENTGGVSFIQENPLLLSGGITIPLEAKQGVTVGLKFSPGYFVANTDYNNLFSIKPSLGLVHKVQSIFFKIIAFLIELIPFTLFIVFFVVSIFRGKGRGKISGVKPARKSAANRPVTPYYLPPRNIEPAHAFRFWFNAQNPQIFVALVYYWATKSRVTISHQEGKKYFFGLQGADSFHLIENIESPVNASVLDRVLLQEFFGAADKVKDDVPLTENSFTKMRDVLNALQKNADKALTTTANPMYKKQGALFSQYILTPDGERLFEEMRGFREYLLKVEKPVLDKMLADDPGYFNTILPRAVLFGVETRLLKLCEDILHSVDWYDSYNHTALNVLAFNSITSQIKNSAIAPRSSGSGGSGFSSGGGFSGGGGGGGGGGSW